MLKMQNYKKKILEQVKQVSRILDEKFTVEEQTNH